MTNETFNYYVSIPVRYADLDAQQHVNNATYLSYFEIGRLGYYAHLKLYDVRRFDGLGMIVVNAQVSYFKSIQLGDNIRLGVKVSRMGSKSLDFDFSIEDEETHEQLASGKTVMVAYDNQQHATIPIPDDWRAKISAFEHLKG